MTHLRKIMLEELERRNYSAGTIQRYVRFVERFAKHFGKSPDQLGPEHLRSYQAYLLKERKFSPGTVENHVAALRFSSFSTQCQQFVLGHPGGVLGGHPKAGRNSASRTEVRIHRSPSEAITHHHRLELEKFLASI